MILVQELTHSGILLKVPGICKCVVISDRYQLRYMSNITIYFNLGFTASFFKLNSRPTLLSSCSRRYKTEVRYGTFPFVTQKYAS